MCLGLLKSVARQTFKEAGLPQKTTLHSLRHSFVTYHLEHGVSIREVGAHAGHYDIQTTIRYSHVIPKGNTSIRKLPSFSGILHDVTTDASIDTDADTDSSPTGDIH